MNHSQHASTSPIPVIIVGAGPAGLTAATLLGQYGVHCLVLDRWDGVYPQPRAVHLDDEIYRIIDRLGIADQFAAVSRPTRGLQLIDRNHHVFATLDRDGGEGRHGHPRANMFDQPELEHLMRTNLKDQSTVRLRGNVEVTDVSQDGQGRVQVDFTDRLTGQDESLLASYVLGCDGANSIVRATIGATMQDLVFEQRWLVIDIATTADLRQWEGVHQVCDPRRAATFMRIGETRYRWEFRLLPGETAADYETTGDLLPLINPWVQGAPSDRLELVRVAEYTFRAQLADHWRDRNVFLLGDAAHLTPPFVGQGMGAGLRDAMNLSWKIAGVLSGDLPESVLDTYQEERKPHAQAMIRLAKLVGVSMTQGGRAGELLRQLIAPRAHWVPGLRQRLLDGETPRLTRSTLNHRPPARRTLAGSLCPNALLADGRRLDDLTANGFLLVTAAPLTPHQQALLEARGAQAIEVQAGSPLHDWLFNGRATAALVRPDMTVMQAGRDVAALCEAVPRFTTMESEK